MPTYDASIIDQIVAHVDKINLHVDGFQEGLAEIGDRLVDALINIAGDNRWQSQSLAKQIVWIQRNLRGQLNQLGYDRLAAKFVNHYDESELFGRQILQEMGKLSGQLIPIRSDTVANLRAFDLAHFDEFGNEIVRSLSKELVLNTIVGKSRAEVIKTLTAEMEGQERSATLYADTALRSFDRYVTSQQWLEAEISQFKFFGPADSHNRPFCRAHVNHVYDITAIRAMNNGSTRFPHVLIYGGGLGCRHVWVPQVDARPESE